MNYLDEMNRAIEYIESHLTEDLIVGAISKEAGISRWHFQRVFKAVLGETVKDYTLRRRLSLAAHELMGSDQSIIEVALKFKFESHEGFTRAFKRLFGMNPSEFRKLGERGRIPLKPKITWDYLNHIYQGISMEPRIVVLEKAKVRGVAAMIQAINAPGFTSNLEVIPRLWQDLKLHLGDLSLQKVSMIDSDLEYFAGVLVKGDELAALAEREVPAGEYAEFIHRGPMSGIGHTMNYIYGSWFPRSGRKRGEGPELSFHTEQTNPSSASNVVRILIPLRP